MESSNAAANRVVLITGAKGGLGSYVTQAFLRTGATVVGASRSITPADFPAENFIPLSADFTNSVSLNSAIRSMVSQLGKLDVLVHVMGGFAGGKTIAETDDSTWDQMRDLNLSSAFYTLRAAIPHLRRSNSGRIVAVGSLAAVEPHGGLGAYVIFKSALTTLLRTVALENKDVGLAANLILPGTMDTPANRKAMPNENFSNWVQPNDVADLVLSLCEPRARHFTGLAVPIEGKSV